jgi:hypothetical protein
LRKESVVIRRVPCQIPFFISHPVDSFLPLLRLSIRTAQDQGRLLRRWGRRYVHVIIERVPRQKRRWGRYVHVIIERVPRQKRRWGRYFHVIIERVPRQKLRYVHTLSWGSENTTGDRFQFLERVPRQKRRWRRRHILTLVPAPPSRDIADRYKSRADARDAYTGQGCESSFTGFPTFPPSPLTGFPTFPPSPPNPFEAAHRFAVKIALPGRVGLHGRGWRRCLFQHSEEAAIRLGDRWRPARRIGAALLLATVHEGSAAEAVVALRLVFRQVVGLKHGHAPTAHGAQYLMMGVGGTAGKERRREGEKEGRREGEGERGRERRREGQTGVTRKRCMSVAYLK